MTSSFPASSINNTIRMMTSSLPGSSTNNTMMRSLPSDLEADNQWGCLSYLCEHIVSSIPGGGSV